AHYVSPGERHAVSGIAGIEQRRQTVSGYKTTAFGYDEQSLINKPVNLQMLASGTPPAFPEAGNVGTSLDMADYFGESYNDRRFMSYYGEATYTFDKKYIATGSVRLDQSNLFGTSPE